MTQHQKILSLCSDGKVHCQNEFRAMYIFSPHKRRSELEGRKNRREKPTGKYIFDVTPCAHGVAGQHDYRMMPNPDYAEPPKQSYEEYQKELLMHATQ